MKYVTYCESPVGEIGIACEGGAVTDLFFRERSDLPDAVIEETDLLRRVKDQLSEYFSGVRKTFDLPLAPKGTAFQRSVWDALLTIPYGQVKTYGEIAAQAGNPKAARAVGMANNKNPIAIIIPCHRVIGATGGLVGYASGIERKQLLLDLEAGADKACV